jgi:hypothetical protein
MALTKDSTRDEIRTAFTAALRSGKYPQGKTTLHNRSYKSELTGKEIPEGFCCLGVLCELAVEAGVIAAPFLLSESPSFVYGDEEQERAGLPRKVRKWSGINSSLGDYTTPDGREAALAFDNDEGLTFDQIADIIESNPDGLFAMEPVTEPVTEPAA